MCVALSSGLYYDIACLVSKLFAISCSRLGGMLALNALTFFSVMAPHWTEDELIQTIGQRSLIEAVPVDKISDQDQLAHYAYFERHRNRVLRLNTEV